MDYSLLDKIIVGRVEPHIYAFSTNTVPNYLKVGDTYRPVAVRLKEWAAHYPTLKKEFDAEAKVGDVFFRDFAIHAFLENEKNKVRLRPSDLPDGIYYSKEFFKNTSASDIEEAICDIKDDYTNKTQKYLFYSADTLKPEDVVFARTDNYPLRPNQEQTVESFQQAITTGHHNLLMYAVMRFGKSFTSMCCAVKMEAKLVVVVSAKADVLTEWKRTVESHEYFADYDFVCAKNLSRNYHIITEKLTNGRKVVAFLTLQDLQGDKIKDKHQEVFGQEIDLLLVDETHFGARAEKYGEVLKSAKYVADTKNKKDTDDFVEASDADDAIKVLKAKNTIHLSGTPYRILMGSEFAKDDIIAFYQFTDIVDDQQKWDEEHILDDNYKEWDNPYYGFPQMVRFAFVPNESSRKALENLKKNGTTYAFSALFKPKSIKRTDDGLHKQFVYEKEILDLFSVIDGSKDDDCLLEFLDYDKIKEGKMCRHMVVVLPYCASCDALENLLKSNKDNFKNIGDYEIVNISGVDSPNKYKTSADVKRIIAKLEAEGKKTITLTVNRMLTGSTVPEWDTMLFFKDTVSPQEYDQAIFRLQNQYVKTYTDENGDTIKYNMKPQTLLVDFDPNRMFVMQERKSKIYNANVESGGNSELEKRIRRELEISPIITVNKDKIVKVTATDILEAISNYQKDKGIRDEALEIPVDLSILEDSAIRAVIELENEIGSKSGLSVPAHDSENEDDGSDIDVPESPSSDDTTPSTDTTPSSADDKHKQEISLTKKVQSYYTRILLFAFITNDTVISLSDIIAKMDTTENGRIAKNLGLSKHILTLLNQKTNKFVLSDLDYKIQDLNNLSRATDLSPAERANVAVNKFGKLGDAIVITPSNICDDMVNLLPEELMESLPATNGKVLDIAGTAGEFAVALYKRMTELGLNKNFIANAIYTIPKSSICYELTRKLYEMLDLNPKNIAKEFIATDMLDVKVGDEIDYDKIKALLGQNKPFETIKLTDTLEEGETEMLKFEAVVGNPPYQENDGGGGQGASSSTLYDKFVYLSDKLKIKYLSMIIKANWTVGGKALNKFRQKMLNDKSIKFFIDYTNADMCFEGVQFPGGVCYFLKEKGYNDKCEITTITQKGITKSRRYLLEEGCDTYIRYSEAISILEKVRNKKEKTFDAIVSSRNIFDLQTNFRGKEAGEYTCFTSSGKCFVDKNDFSFDDSVNNYKVMVSYANGAAMANIPYSVISKPFIAKPKELCSDTYLVIGCFDKEILANNVAKYMKTRMFRFLLSLKKSTPVAAKKTYSFIPLQDFTDKSDIDWSKSVAEIDKQLYAKYGLDDTEIAFIESMIKPME